MGLADAAAKRRNDNSTRRALHAIGQPDPRAETGRTAYRRLHTALGVPLAAHLSESKAWEIYRERLKRFASLIGDRELIVLHKQIPGMGRAKRYVIEIADDDRAPIDRLCQKLITAGAVCDITHNAFGQN
jgi:hypothetical protein